MYRKQFSLGCTMALAIAVVLPMLAITAWARSKEKVLYEFPGGKHGYSPVGGVVFDKAGNLYGTTEYAGAYGWGTVFELKRSGTGWKQIVLYSFEGHDDGWSPFGNLVLDQTGNLYGFTPWGGTGVSCYEGQNYGCGTVYKLSRSHGRWIHTVLYSFSGAADGAYPWGVILDREGNVYGVTSQGGTNQCVCGTVFKLTPTRKGWSETVLYSFAGGTDGANPLAGVIFDGSGNLYGTTYAGGANSGGTVFQLSPNSGGWTETVLYSFGTNGRYDGYTPESSLVFDARGNLYGTTTAGGASSPGCPYGCGTVFQLTSSSQGQWVESILFSFDRFSGEYPESEVALDQAGALYGTTYAGGLRTCGEQDDCGVVFKLTPDAGRWTEIVLHFFTGGNDGYQPRAGVALDGRDNVYGTTSARYGTVFKVTP
jgi:uncharacterized repeat protein (TIGR03803 family)